MSEKTGWEINENIKFVTSLSKYNNPVKQIVEEIVYIISKFNYDTRGVFYKFSFFCVIF